MPMFNDDEEDPIIEISPDENVYSYFMFVTPTERKKEGKGLTFDVLMSYLLVALSFFMQAILLYCVFNKVVVKNVNWQDGIMNEGGESWNLLATVDGCNDGGSLCVLDNTTGRFSCSPPSVQLSGRWDELDTNGDGIWTRSEVIASRDTLKCKYVVDPVEVFDVYTSILMKREGLIWIHPEIKAGEAIRKAYFEFVMGDIIICGYRSHDMCNNLLKRGVFDAPLRYGTSPRVGKTIDSALDYCYELLKPGGICERSLPSTYATWKTESTQQCKKAKFSPFVYANPGNGVKKSLLEVDYKARQNYEQSKSTFFLTYKFIIIFLWTLAMVFHLKDILKVAVWVVRFPDVSEVDEEVTAKEEDGNTTYEVNAIDKCHRFSVGLVTLGRLLLICILLYVGISFLLRQTDYIGLLLDGVALVFIVEIAEIIYNQTLRPKIKEQCQEIAPMKVQDVGVTFLIRRPALVDILWLVAIGCFASIVLHRYTNNVVNPLYDSLDCICRSRGDRCREAQSFDFDFWQKYWRHDVPGVFDAVAALKNSTAMPAVGTGGAHGPNRAPALVTRLLQRAASHAHLSFAG